LDAKANDLALKKEIIFAKYEEGETGSNLGKSFKEGYGSKRAVLQMMSMMIMIVVET
jgi:hypothetical protein